MTTTTPIEIDATDRALGRVASEAARYLMGKHEALWQPQVKPTTKVKIVNASKLSISSKKAGEKLYSTYSGYPGGLKQEPLSRLADRRGYSEVMRRAVKGMLPKNKLQDVMLKNLLIEE